MAPTNWTPQSAISTNWTPQTAISTSWRPNDALSQFVLLLENGIDYLLCEDGNGLGIETEL